MARIGLALLFVGALAAWAFAQAPQPTPTVISGNDLGFRIENQRGGVPTGKLVVRINGEWVEAHFAAGPKRLGSQ